MNFVGKALKASDRGAKAAAAQIGCDDGVLSAVIAVETGGRGFDNKQRPKALFEPHVFYRLLDAKRRRDAVNAGLAYKKWGTRPYPRDSYPLIVAACQIDEEIALQATSWGLPQILGQNYRAAGFRSSKELVAAFCESEDAQLAAMASFIVANRLDKALVRKDWATFAKGYNGPSYKTLGYDLKLARAYSHFSRARSGDLPQTVTPDVKNMVRTSQFVSQSKRSSAVALSVAVATPIAATVAGYGHAGTAVASLMAVGSAAIVVGFFTFAWRALGRIELYK
jgi:hypothetical protein